MTDQLTVEHHAWIEAALHRLGAAAQSTPLPFKIRPWSSVASIETDRGRLWFKANEPALAFESELLVVLSHAVPGRVLKPLDRDSSRGWFLTAHGGPTGAEVDVPTREAIAAIAELQHGSARHIADVLTAGTPDRRPAHLPEILERAIAHPSSGEGGERCAKLVGPFTRACKILSADRRLAVVNSDHKPAHLFAGPPVRVFDWGDAVVSHPLTDLPFIEREFGPAAGALLAEAWDVDPAGALAAAAGAAAELLEADVWLRTSPEGLARHPDGIDVALGRLADRLEAVPGSER